MLKAASFYRLTSPISLAAVVALLAGCGSGGGSNGGAGVLPTAPTTQAAPNVITPTTQNLVPSSTQGDSTTSGAITTSPASTPPVATTPVAPTSVATTPTPVLKGSFDPNYISDLVNGTASWASLPVKVSFVQDANYTLERQDAATSGFDEWVSSTNGVISYQIVPDAGSTGITVRFDPTQANSVTTTTILGSTVTGAAMSLGIQLPGDSTRQINDVDLQVGAAHEMGHALGIEGHSKQFGDVMYFEHAVGVPSFVDQNDLNTMKTIYYALFVPGRSTNPHPSQPFGPLRVVTLQ